MFRMHKIVLFKKQEAVLGAVLMLMFLLELFTPSRPYFLGNWHQWLTVAVVFGASMALGLSWNAWRCARVDAAVYWLRVCNRCAPSGNCIYFSLGWQ